MSPFQPVILAKAGSYSYIPAQQNMLGRWSKTPWLTPGCTMGASLTHIRVSPLLSIVVVTVVLCILACMAGI